MSIKIFEGIPSPYYMGKLLGQEDLKGIERIVFLEKDHIPGKSFHIAVHIIDDSYQHQNAWCYDKLHAHSYDEINILIPFNSRFQYRFEFDGNFKNLYAPVTIYIPAGIKHRAEPVCGKGVFVCIHLDQIIACS